MLMQVKRLSKISDGAVAVAILLEPVWRIARANTAEVVDKGIYVGVRVCIVAKKVKRL